LINGEPHLMNLKTALKVFIEHRLTVVERRSRFDLEKAQARAHILDGLRIALKNLDEIITLIRKSDDTEDARNKLMKRFKLSEIQSQAILDMPLKRLAALERKKIELEYQELEATIKDLQALLASPRRMRQVVEKELLTVKETYNDRRRTQIVSLKEGEKSSTLLTKTDLMPAETVWVGVTKEMVIGRTLGDDLPRFRGGDAPAWLLKATTHQTLYLVAKNGKASAIAIHSLPEVERFAEGQPLAKVSAFREDNHLAAVFTSEISNGDPADSFVVTCSKMGLVKKSAMSDLPGPSVELFTLAKVNDDDELNWVVKTNGKQDLLLVTKQGMGIRFSEEDVRPMGLVAAGVNGLKMASDDALVGASAISDKEEVLLLANNGTAWRMTGSEFPRQGRYGQGVAACKLAKGAYVTGLLVGSKTQGGIIHLAKLPARQIRLDAIPAAKRTRSGHELLELKGADVTLGITPIEGAMDGHRERIERTETPRREHAEQPDLFKVAESDGKKTTKAEKPAVDKPARTIKAKSSEAVKSKTAPAAKTKTSAKAEPVKVRPAASVKEKTGKAAPAKSAASAKAAPVGKAKTAKSTVKSASSRATAKPATKAGLKPAASKAKTPAGKPAVKAPKTSKSKVPALAGGEGEAPAEKTPRQRVKVK
jgi:DNA gyrase subunit A